MTVIVDGTEAASQDAGASKSVTHFYRIRGLQRAISELENQEIFFAHPAKLNDPVEGLRDVFWLGDGIVWRNLIKHYLVCLNIAWGLLGIVGEETPIDWRNIPVFQFQGPDFNPSMKAMHDEIFASFFSVPEVAALVAALAGRRLAIRRAELTASLGCVGATGAGRTRDGLT